MYFWIALVGLSIAWRFWRISRDENEVSYVVSGVRRARGRRRGQPTA